MEHVGKFQSYLRRQAGDENSLPLTLRELNDSWHIRLVLKPRTDPDETFDSSAVAFYFTGGQDDINNMFVTLDNYFNDCYTNPEPGLSFREPLKVQYSFNQNVRVTFPASEMTVATVFTDPTHHISVAFHAAGPPWGDRHITATLDFLEQELHVTFSGNLYPLRRSFDQAHIGGNYGETDDSGRREYFRLPEPALLDDEAALARIEEAMTSVVKHTLVRCIVRTAPNAEGAGKELLLRLLGLPQLRF